jgi:hypothetical protein
MAAAAALGYMTAAVATAAATVSLNFVPVLCFPVFVFPYFFPELFSVFHRTFFPYFSPVFLSRIFFIFFSSTYFPSVSMAAAVTHILFINH